MSVRDTSSIPHRLAITGEAVGSGYTIENSLGIVGSEVAFAALNRWLDSRGDLTQVQGRVIGEKRLFDTYGVVKHGPTEFDTTAREALDQLITNTAAPSVQRARDIVFAAIDATRTTWGNLGVTPEQVDQLVEHYHDPVAADLSSL
jgi:hypothetical protein